jgi:hypothetical protein
MAEEDFLFALGILILQLNDGFHSFISWLDSY